MIVIIWTIIILLMASYACALGVVITVIHDRVQKGSWFWERD